MSRHAGETPSADRPTRRSVRLAGYNYSLQGAYFVTICVQDRLCLFGTIAGDQVELNEAGRMVHDEWEALPERFPAVLLDAFVIMPNHLHGIIVIRNPREESGEAEVAQRPALGAIIQAFKSLSTVQYGRHVKSEGWPRYRKRLWQRSYYEHVIRSGKDLERIRRYIADNPAGWSTDQENPDAGNGHTSAGQD